MAERAGDRRWYFQKDSGYMRNSNQRHTGDILLDRGLHVFPLASTNRRNKNLPVSGQRRAMIILHRTLFAIMLIAAFFQGAVDAGRRDLLEQFIAGRLISMSFYELGQIKVSHI